MSINCPSHDLVKLEKARHTPSVSFHTGSLYFTARSSQIISLQPGESQKLSYTLNADCDVTSLQETSLISSDADPSPAAPCNSISSALPFQEVRSEMPSDKRQIKIEFPDGYAHVLNAAFKIESVVSACSFSQKAPAKEQSDEKSRAVRSRSREGKIGDKPRMKLLKRDLRRVTMKTAFTPAPQRLFQRRTFRYLKFLRDSRR